MLLCTSICICTYVSKDSLLSLCVTGMDVSKDNHWGHDLIAQSLFSGSYNLSSPETLSWHKSPVLLLSGADGPSAGRFLPWVAVASLRKGMWRTATPVDWRPHSCGQCFSYLLPFIEAWAGPRDPPTSPTAHHRPTLSLWLPLCFLFPDPSQDTTTPSPVCFPLLSHFPWDSGLFLTPVAGQHLSERWQALTLIHPASACQGSETDSPSWSSSEWAHPHLVFNLKDHSKIWPVFQIQKTGSWPYGNICCIN